MPLVWLDNYSNLAITLYGVRSQLLENMVIEVIQGIFIPTGCLILLTFLLKINCLQVNTLNVPLMNLAVCGLHPLHWGHCEFCVCLHRVCETLKISRIYLI